MSEKDDSDEAAGNGGGLEKNLEAKLNAEGYSSPQSEVYGFSRYVCQILVRTVKGTTSVGTGFLIGPNLVLTNFHVVEHVQPDNLECRFDVRSTDVGPKIGPAYGVSVVLARRPYSNAEADATYTSLSTKHPEPDELDYALLQLDARVGDEKVEVVQDTIIKRHWLDLPELPPETDSSKNVYVLQHPGGGAIRAASGALVTDQPPSGTRLRYLANTESGSSGSPCFQWSADMPHKLLLVAIHNYGHEGRGAESGFNQGIPVHLIRKDLDFQVPAWDSVVGDDLGSDTSEESVDTRQAEIERDVTSGEGFETAETDAERVVGETVATADDGFIAPIIKSFSRGMRVFFVAASSFLALGIAGYFLVGYFIVDRSGAPESETVTTPLQIGPPDTDMAEANSCSITATATLNSDYGDLPEGEPLSVKLSFAYSGALGVQMRKERCKSRTSLREPRYRRKLSLRILAIMYLKAKTMSLY